VNRARLSSAAGICIVSQARFESVGDWLVPFLVCCAAPTSDCHGASTRIALLSPRFVRQFVPADHSSGISDQCRQSFELLPRESNSPSLTRSFQG
jgi:hypothetical protein